MFKLRSGPGSYVAAVVCAGLGIALPLVSKPFIGQSAPWVSFVPAVLLSAWYGGFGPGIVTAAILTATTLTLDQLLFSTKLTSGSKFFGAFMFSVAALAICFVIRALRVAQTAAIRALKLAREANASARAGRDRLELILRDLPVGVIIATEDGKIELANPAAREIHALPLKPGEALPSNNSSPIERSLRNGETIVNEEIDIACPDIATRSVMINSRPIEGRHGQPAAIAAYADVTSLRAAQKALLSSERRLRRLFDSPIIGVVSGEGNIAIEANDGFLRLLGFSRDDLQHLRIDFSTFTPPEFHDADTRATAQFTARGFSDPYVKEFTTVDGRRVPAMVGVAAIDESAASPWIAWVLDLSEHRKLEERVRQAAKAESIGLLAGGVAHDFNNLLTIILGNASIAYETLPEGSSARTRMDDAIKAAERAADLTRQLLAYAGKGRFVVRQADVSAAIADIDRLFRASAPREVEVKLDLAAGLAPIHADVTQLQQLVMNLVINGVESIAGSAGTVTVKTSAATIDEDFLHSSDLLQEIAPGRYILIEVTDDGCGMDSETRLRIFDPFFTTKFTGRGLGLAAAAGIVRAHRGGIVVKSSPGHGSVFQVYLPTVPKEGNPETVEPAQVRAMTGQMTG